MTHFYKKQILHMIVIILLLFSSLGNSISVIAETINESSVEEQVEDIGETQETIEETLVESEEATEDESEPVEATPEEVVEDGPLLDREPRNAQLLNTLDNFWISRFLQGNASGNRTQFPTTFRNYFLNDSRASIVWSGSNQLGNRTGNSIVGRIMLPRQFLYRDGNSLLYAGVDFYGMPTRNQYQFGVNTIQHGQGDFHFTIQETTPYQIKGPVLSPSNLNEGTLADFQEFTIRVERIRDASFTSQRANSFTVDLDWIFNTYFYFATIWNHSYYPNFVATVNQAIRGSFTELPAHTLAFARNPSQGASANPSAPVTTLAQGATTTVTAAAPATGYQFAGFDVSGTGSSITNVNTSNRTGTFTMGSQNATVTARYELSNRTLTLARSPQAGSASNPTAPTTSLVVGATTTVTAGAPSPGYRLVGFNVTGNGTITNVNLANRTATFTMGTENATVTAEYASTVIRNAEDLGKFLRSEFPYDSNEQTYTIEPETNQTIDMSGQGNFSGRSQFSGNLIGNGTIIRNLSLVSQNASLGLIQTINGSNLSRIENLTLAGISLNNTRSSSNSAGIIGQVASGKTVELENITIDESSQIAANQPAGNAGLIGNNQGSVTIKNSEVSGTLHSNTANGLMGGLVGQNQGQLTIENSVSRVTFTGGGSYTLNIGGLVGETSSEVTITDSRSESHTAINSASGTYRGGMIGRVTFSGNVMIKRSINASDMRGNNSIVGGFIGRMSGTARIEESYHNGHVQGSTSLGTAAFIGLTEGGGALGIMDSYSIGSSNGNGVIGVNQLASNVTLNQLFIAGFTGGQPITSDTTGITATNVYYDSSTTNKATTTGVGEAKTTLELIESTTAMLGFGNRWRTDFSVAQRTNKTYPYLSWQTQGAQPVMFFDSIDPMVDRQVTGNQVSVTLDLQNEPLKLFNPYSSGLAGEATTGTFTFNRGSIARVSIGVINQQGVVGFTARRMTATSARNPIAGSDHDPEIEKNDFLEGETTQIKAAAPNQGYRFVGFSVTGAGSSVSNIDLNARTATVTIGTENTVITAEYASTIIRNADDLGKFLRSESPYDANDQTYTIEPETNQTIDMSGEGDFSGRSQFSGHLIGNGTIIKNLSLVSQNASLGLIQTINGSNLSRIENLTLAGISLNNTRSSSNSAGIIGQVASGKSVELENITIDESSRILANQPNGSAGLIGNNMGSVVVKNSEVSGTLHSNTANGLMGGLVGKNDGPLTIESSLSRVTFTGGGSYTLNIGGLVGETSSEVIITDSVSESQTAINSLSGTYRGGMIGRVTFSGDVTIQRSINAGDMRGNNSNVGGFIGRMSGTAKIEESYHNGHVQGSTSLGTAGFIGMTEGNGALSVVDSYSIGSSNGNGVIGINQLTDRVTLSQLFVAGFTGVQPITSDTTGITATNVYYDSSTTNKATTTGVGEAKTTLELIESTTAMLGFGNRWRTDFSVAQRTNKTYPYLSWQTQNTQPSMFFDSIDPMVDRQMTGNQVAVTLDLQNEPLKLFNPYSSGLAGEATAGTFTFNRGSVARVSIGVINQQGVVGFTARRMSLTLVRDPLAGSAADPNADRTNFIEGETTTIQAAEANAGYRFVGFSVTGTGSTVTRFDQENRTATFTMGTEDATVTANYVQTVIRTAEDLSRFLNSQAPFDKDDENYSIEPEDGIAIDMANAGTFSGRQVYGAKLIGNHAVIKNLTLTSGEIDLAFIRSVGNDPLRIENLTFENLRVTNTRGQSFTNYTAGVIAVISAGSIVELENIRMDSSSSILSNQSNGSGAFVGNNSGQLTITNGQVSSNLHSNTSNGLLGGLVGRTTGVLTMSHSSSKVNFTGGNNYSLNLGGLIGEVSGTVTITDTHSETRSTVNSSISSYRGGLIGFVTENGQVHIERSINSSDLRSGNSYAGGFIGRLAGNVTINESYHSGYILGNVANGSGGFIGRIEDSGQLVMTDNYGVGSSNGQGVIGAISATATAQLTNLFVAGFTAGEPISNTTTGITANNVYFDASTTRKTTTSGVGEARSTTGLIDATITELGFGEKWFTGFALGSSANRTYPYLRWQTNGAQTSEFFNSIQPEVDTAVSTNQVTVTLDLTGHPVRLFNPYQADLAGEVTTGTFQINRNNAERFSIGVINEQGIIGFTGIGNYTDIQPNSQVLNYGYGETDYQAKDFVKVFKDQTETDDYDARFVSFPDSLNGQSARVEVSKNGTVLATIDVPVTYQFGHSLNVRGISFQGTDLRAATLSLNSDQTQIVATYNSALAGTSVHSYFGNDMYYQIRHYNQVTVSNGPMNAQTPDFDFSVNGNQRLDTLNGFGTNRRLSVAKGDIVEIFHAEANGRLDNIKDNVVQPRISDNRSRYQITANGFERINIDRLNPSEQKTVLGMSREDMDRQIGRYLDISQYPTLKIEGFTQYPDTSKEGTTTGKIVVSESLVNGEKATWEYTVPFVVESDPAIHVTLPVRMAFDVLDDQVTSDDYQVINHSTTTELTVSFHTKNDVELASTSNIVFLDSSEQEATSESMFLYLQRIGATPSDKPLVGQASTFAGAQWTESVPSDSQMSLGFTGKYFGDPTQNNKVTGKLSLHFAAKIN
ncbi:InlB B-repeat-containing protein [Enterococcus mundtii]|uniref:InlB B-repeat-containing protein n=1 Tax=Enterococcus mundtii TaxID=53346 RepID=UPI0011575D3A|nr:putative mucin/carbohydrate-binding domain-containing protein [Enterococcus mundtii]